MATRLHRHDIVDGLRRLGIQSGDVAFFHTSLKRFGAEIEGGPNTIIDAVLEAVSPGGTVGAPAHGSVEAGPFAPREAPVSAELGLLPRVFAARPDAMRSLHPTHSVVAIGPEAAELLEGHERCTSGVGAGSPWDKLRRHPRGKVVLLGIGIARATLFHLAEALAPAPYAGVPFREDAPRARDVVRPDGAIVTVSVHDNPGCSEGFVRLEPLLREKGLITETRIAEATCLAFPAGPSIDAAMAAVRENGTLLLAGPDHCDFCRRAFAHVATRRAGGGM